MSAVRSWARAGAAAAAVAAVVAAAGVVGGGGGCDYRPWLAESDLFAGFRPELIQECCNCLARRGTAFPGSACGPAAIAEGGEIVVEGDAGPAIPANAPFFRDDLDDVIDENEIPCLCGEGENVLTCTTALGDGESVVVTGACISQGNIFGKAPCEDECDGVLTFDPLTPASD